jgi:hypothetical protein
MLVSAALLVFEDSAVSPCVQAKFRDCSRPEENLAVLILIILVILVILIDFLLACARGGCEQSTCQTCQQSTCRPTVKDYEDESAWQAPTLVVDQSCQMPELSQ